MTSAIPASPTFVKAKIANEVLQTLMWRQMTPALDDVTLDAAVSKTTPEEEMINKIIILGRGYGGQRGIRTLDTVTRIHAFQACAFNHSATCPLVPEISLSR